MFRLLKRLDFVRNQERKIYYFHMAAQMALCILANFFIHVTIMPHSIWLLRFAVAHFDATALFGFPFQMFVLSANHFILIRRFRLSQP